MSLASPHKSSHLVMRQQQQHHHQQQQVLPLPHKHYTAVAPTASLTTTSRYVSFIGVVTLTVYALFSAHQVSHSLTRSPTNMLLGKAPYEDYSLYLGQSNSAASTKIKASPKQNDQPPQQQSSSRQPNKSQVSPQTPQTQQPPPSQSSSENQSHPMQQVQAIHQHYHLPSKPLCELCLNVIRRRMKARGMLDLDYVDVSGGPNLTQRKPLHFGAFPPFSHNRTALGQYIHDAKALRRQSLSSQPPLHMQWTEHQLRQACLLRDADWRMLQKIHVVTEQDLENQRQTLRTVGGVRYARPEKILCMIYSTSEGHAKVQRIRETWGPKCDGFMVASNVTNPELNAVSITHKFDERYRNMWQKVRTMWSYVYDHYYNDYDWFHVGGDDLYLIVENLRYYLESEEIKTAANGGVYLPLGNETKQVPLYLGCRQKRQGRKKDIYNSGGSGYTLNKAALKALVTNGLPKLYVDTKTSAEDVLIAWVLRRLAIYPYETKDEMGSERYNPHSPGYLYRYRKSNAKSDWYSRYSIDIQPGLNHSSVHSVAFHYIKNDDMYKLHALLYGLCPADTLNVTMVEDNPNKNNHSSNNNESEPAWEDSEPEPSQDELLSEETLEGDEGNEEDSSIIDRSKDEADDDGDNNDDEKTKEEK